MDNSAVAIGNPAAAEWVPVAALTVWDQNPKPHDASNLKEIARSIRRFDFGAPIVAWKSQQRVVAGHGRLLAAQLLLTEDPGRLLATDAPGPGLVPVRWVEFASEQEAAAYALADNRLTEANPMDESQVAAILASFEGPVEIPGYDEEALSALLALNEPAAPDEPEGDLTPPEEPQSRVGEVYELGPHRLVCGDCTDPLIVEKVMCGEFAASVLTDPPYGQNQPGVTNDAPEMLAGIVNQCSSVLPMKNGVCVAFASPRTFPMWLDAVRRAGHAFERMLWLYKEAQNSYPWRGWLLTSEAILVSSIGVTQWNDVHPYKHDCYKISEVSGEIESSIGWHGSIKPLAVISDICVRISHLGEIVYDPFGGSGTTLIACAQTGRRCRMIELDPRYCDVIRKRWGRYALEAGVAPGPGALP